MAILVVQTPSLAGSTQTLAAASVGGDAFPNSGTQMFAAKNGHATQSRTVTFASQAACSFGVTNAVHDVAVVIPALTTKLIGPFLPARFNDANGRVVVTYSDAAADLTVAAQAAA